MSSDSSVLTKSVVQAALPLSALRESPTNPRKFFDATSLKELSDSVKEHGVLEPLIVRPNGKPSEYEIICGARRYRASKMAGLTEVPVVFRELTDDEVAVVQLVENGQRADLSPFEEADTFAALAEKGLSVAVIAKQLGRDAKRIARRLPLAKLPKRVKDVASAGMLPVEHAELIARIPDQKLQEKALGRILEDRGDEKPIVAAVPYALAKRIVEEEFMTALSVAVFDPEDAELSPLGACSKCPHLAGNSPLLFGDVKGRAVCTNPKDFRLKTENHLKRLRDAGYTVLTPKELKRAFPYGESDELGKEFIDLERVCADDPKHRRYEELLGRAEKLRIVFALRNGQVRRLYPAKDLRAALVASGHSFAKPIPEKRTSDSKAAASAAKLEAIGQEAVARELAIRLRSVKLAPGGWIDLLVRIAVVVNGWKIEGVLRRHGFEGTREEFAKNRERIIKDAIDKMTDAEKRSFLVDLLFGDRVGSREKAEEDLYRYLLKLAGVEYAKVANRAIDDAKRKGVQAKDSPKPPVAAKTVRAPKAVERSAR